MTNTKIPPAKKEYVRRTVVKQSITGRQRLRQEVLAFFFAKDARDDKRVIRFRKQVLKGNFPLPTEKVFDWDKTQNSNTLNRLKKLSKELAKEYQWTEVTASIFLLTDATPEVLLYKAKSTYRKPLFTASRITLTLDPALTDQEVAAIYRKERQKMLKRDRRGKARFYTQSEKHLQLALFEATQPEGKTYRMKMNDWNKKFPKKWRYKHESHFGRDSKKAVQRLLQPDYFDWEGLNYG